MINTCSFDALGTINDTAARQQGYSEGALPLGTDDVALFQQTTSLLSVVGTHHVLLF